MNKVFYFHTADPLSTHLSFNHIPHPTISSVCFSTYSFLSFLRRLV